MSGLFPSKMRSEPRNAITMLPAENNTSTSKGSHIKDTVQTNREPPMGSLGPGDLPSEMKLHSTDTNAHRHDNTESFARNHSFASVVEGTKKQNTNFPFGNSTQTSEGLPSKGLFGQSDPLSLRRVDTRTTQGVFSIPYRHLLDSELFDIAQEIQTNSSSATSGSILDLRKVLDIFARNEVSNDSLITTGILNRLDSLQYHTDKEIRERSGCVVSRFRHQIGAGKPFPGSTFTLKEESHSNECPKLDEKQPTEDLATSDFSKPKDLCWTSLLQYQNQVSSSNSSASTKNILRQPKRTPSTQSQLSSSQRGGDIPSSFEALSGTKKLGTLTSKPPIRSFGTANFGIPTTGSLYPIIVRAVPIPRDVDVGSTSTPSKRQPEKVSGTTAFGFPNPPAKSTHFRQQTPNFSKFWQSQEGNAANAKDVSKPVLNFEGRPLPMSTRHNALTEEIHTKNHLIDELSTKIVDLEYYKKETSSKLIETANALENLRERLKIAQAISVKQDAELRANHRRKMDSMIAKKDIEKDSVAQAMKLKYEARIEEADRKSRLYIAAQDNIQRLEEKIHDLEHNVVDISLAKTAVERKYQNLSMKTTELEEFEKGYRQIQGQYNELENECNDFAAECKGLKEKLQALEEATENSSGSKGHKTAGLLASTNTSRWIAARTTAADHLDGLVYQRENQLQLKAQSLWQKRHHIEKTDFEIAEIQLLGPPPELDPIQAAEHSDQVHHSMTNITSFMPSDVGPVPLGNENIIPIPERRPKTKTYDYGGPLSVPKQPSSTYASTSLRTWATVAGRGLPPSSRAVLSRNPLSRNSVGQTHGSQSPGQEEEWPVVDQHGQNKDKGVHRY